MPPKRQTHSLVACWRYRPYHPVLLCRTLQAAAVPARLGAAQGMANTLQQPGSPRAPAAAGPAGPLPPPASGQGDDASGQQGAASGTERRSGKGAAPAGGRGGVAGLRHVVGCTELGGLSRGRGRPGAEGLGPRLLGARPTGPLLQLTPASGQGDGASGQQGAAGGHGAAASRRSRSCRSWQEGWCRLGARCWLRIT